MIPLSPNLPSNLPAESPVIPTIMLPGLTRPHQQRLREVYRSSGWPCHDMLEVDLLACGLLERRVDTQGRESLRVTDAGLLQLAQAHAGNKAARSAHELLVERVCLEMARAGRLVWRGLSLRAQVPAPESSAETSAGRSARVSKLDELSERIALEVGPQTAHATASDKAWAMACPDVFSIRHTSVEAYLEPIVHENKVSRADLLGDLKKPNKRAAYLGLGGECWYVLGRDAKGRPIAQPEEIPPECGVMLCEGEHPSERPNERLNQRLVVARPAPQTPMTRLPFHIWMALARATPAVRQDASAQALL